MTSLLKGLHPSFEALSAHADRSDLKAARTRVARHVSTCATCARTVAEIRALGDAARAVELPGAPPGLWARIEAGVRAGDREVARPIARADDSTPNNAAPVSNRPTTSLTGGARTRIGLGVLVVSSIALLAMLFAPGSRQNLGAAPPTRLTLDHMYVAPGATINLRYRPSPALASAQAVTVWAWYRRRDETPEWSWRAELVRAGTLHRSSAEEFTGTVTFPRDVLFAGYAIGDSIGFTMDRMPGFRTTLATALVADSTGNPSFDALVTFLGEPGWVAHGAPLNDAATQLAQRYPDRPETWLLTYPYQQHGMIGDIVKLFETRERAYDGWHHRLEKRRPLSVQTEVMMANMAIDLMDTARADFWVARLVADHRSAPEAASVWLDYHRDTPRDSIAAVLAAFERIWGISTPKDVRIVARALTLAERSGDADLARQWRLLEAEADPYWAIVAFTDESWLADAASRATMAGRIRDRLAKESRDTLGAPTMEFDARRTTEFKRMRREWLRGQLAAIQLENGDAAGARLTLDSVVADADRQGRCPASRIIRWRAEAERKLGDLTQARDDLAYVATTESWQVAVAGDSASQLLGAAYSPTTWNAAKQTATARHQRCFAATRERFKGGAR